MRSFAAACAVLLACALPAAQAETRSWNFRVLLDGKDIGRHRFTQRAQGEQREIRSEASFDVRVLFLSAYRYRHEAIERWDGPCLRSLDSRTQTNDEHQSVNAIVRNGRLVVERSGGREAHEGCVMSFAYWDPQVLKARALLNSQSGELLPVRINLQGEESVELLGQKVAAQRHRIDGAGLRIDLWYAAGQWIALEAQAPGGRLMRYELMRNPEQP
jgi:hypothetical protein